MDGNIQRALDDAMGEAASIEVERQQLVRLVEQKTNSLQQLKAEIRAIHDSLQEAAAENDTECFEGCLVRLRELSAV